MFKLIKEVVKNLKIILRSWTSLSLLVLGPLLLILLIGYTFNNSIPHDIALGVHGTYNVELLQSLDEVGDVQLYSSVALCLEDIKLQRVHLCLDVLEEGSSDIDGDKGGAGFSSAHLLFYFDDANKKMSTLLIANINELIGKRSSQIGLESTRSILDNIQEMVFYVNSNKAVVYTARDELLNTSIVLQERRDRLQEVLNEFTPRYAQVKVLQFDLNQKIISLNDSSIDIADDIEEVRFLVKSLSDVLLSAEDHLSSTSAFYIDPLNVSSFSVEDSVVVVAFLGGEVFKYDLSNATMQDEILLYSSLLQHSISDLENSLEGVDEYYDTSYEDLLLVKEEFDLLIGQLDAVKQLLDDELMFTKMAIVKIDASAVALDTALTDVDTRLSDLRVLDPSLAEVIVSPIVKEYQALLSFRNIETVFPGLLVIVIVFVTLLFANILTLSELNSEAYFRNVIAPVSGWLMPVGVFFSTLTLVLFQVSVLLVIGQFWFHVGVFAHLGQVYMLSSLLVFVFTLVGMILAYLITTQEISVLTTTFVALGFYLFSSIVTPLEMMPVFGAKVALLNPVVLGESLFKKLLLYDLPLLGMGGIEQVTVLCLFVLLLSGIVFVLNSGKRKSQ